MRRLLTSLFILFASQAAQPASLDYDLCTETPLTAEDAGADLVFLAERVAAAFMAEDWPPAESAPGRIRDLAAALPSVSWCRSNIGLLALHALATLKDGHSGIANSETTDLFGPLAFGVEWAGGALLLSGVAEPHEAVLGHRLLAINGVSVDELARRFEQIVPGFTTSEFRRFLPRYLPRPVLLRAIGVDPANDRFELTLGSESGRRVYAIGAVRDENLPVRFINDLRAPAPAFEEREPIWWQARDDLFHLRVRAVSNAEDRPFVGEVRKAFEAIDASGLPRVVVDFRSNGGGNLVLGLSIASEILARPALNRRGNVFVVVNQESYSAAVAVFNWIRAATHAVTVGEAPGNTTRHPGDADRFVLPRSGIEVRISQNVSTVPWLEQRGDPVFDIPYSRSAAEYRAGDDGLFEAIRAFRAGPLPAPLPPDRTGRFADGDLAHAIVTNTDAGPALRVPPAFLVQLAPVSDSRWTGPGGQVIVDFESDDRIHVRFGPEQERWFQRVPDSGRSLWEDVGADDFEGLADAFEAARQGGPDDRLLRDDLLGTIGSLAYFNATAEGVDRDTAAARTRFLLELSQRLNEPSPFADFALQFYQPRDD